GHHYISVNNAAVAPLGESKSHGEIMRLLAARMGLTHPALRESDEEIAASALPDGVSLEALGRDGWHKTFPPRVTLGERQLQFSASPHDAPEKSPSLQLQLLTPKSHYFLNSSFANMPRHRRGMQRPTLDMHPGDASARGLADGERVAVRNERAEVHAWL